MNLCTIPDHGQVELERQRKIFTPEEMSAMILARMKNIAEGQSDEGLGGSRLCHVFHTGSVGPAQF